ncbi:MAG: hypothetical protein RMK97_08965 [Sutterellaceae bacterium]|nr:hypothetical protein [Burkholderiaceae bacterium]MCX7900975.1 hypothetical protein [Burkholderiaceae bacterium]MDW8430612.1 hypothetical protein [Sutterellaceae bacterium]
MFIGHYAAALAAKVLAPRVSLGTLTCAALLADLMFPVLFLLGLERAHWHAVHTGIAPIAFDYFPFSHSLLALLLWGVLFGGLHYRWRRDWAAAAVLAALVVSHWLLDAVVHRPDLPLGLADQVRIGLGLWNSTVATLAVELSLLGGALMLYRRATRGLGLRRWPLWVFVGLLLAAYLLLIFAPQPADLRAVAWAGLTQWLFVAIAWWIDRLPVGFVLSPV